MLQNTNSFFQGLPRFSSVKKCTYHAPFGCELKGRNLKKTGVNKSFRFGFQGQEGDDEIKGDGNSISFGDYGLDTRIARRIGIDPVIKHHMSGYSTFSNNPIIFIDPDGTTDYYNSVGKIIGTDGVDDGKKQIVLTNSTARIIRKATRKCQNISMNEKRYRDIIDVPSSGEITAMDDVYTKTEASHVEEVFAVGEPKESAQKIVIVGQSGDDGSFNPGGCYEELRDMGVSGSYDVHSHPASISYDSETKGFNVSRPTASAADINTTPGYSEFYGNTQPNIVLGYNTTTELSKIPELDLSKAEASPDKRVPISGEHEKAITFYTEKGIIATFKYESFKEAVEKVRAAPINNLKPCKPAVKK
jgi:hypothetical protein